MESASGIQPISYTITYRDPNPNITKTSGDNPASAMETLAMTPVVYTYNNVADAANVLFDCIPIIPIQLPQRLPAIYRL
jgi:hypothetical protein